MSSTTLIANRYPELRSGTRPSDNSRSHRLYTPREQPQLSETTSPKLQSSFPNTSTPTLFWLTTSIACAAVTITTPLTSPPGTCSPILHPPLTTLPDQTLTPDERVTRGVWERWTDNDWFALRDYRRHLEEHGGGAFKVVIPTHDRERYGGGVPDEGTRERVWRDAMRCIDEERRRLQMRTNDEEDVKEWYRENGYWYLASEEQQQPVEDDTGGDSSCEQLRLEHEIAFISPEPGGRSSPSLPRPVAPFYIPDLPLLLLIPEKKRAKEDDDSNQPTKKRKVAAKALTMSDSSLTGRRRLARIAALWNGGGGQGSGR
uniref:Uncharacterized protein n=1 Tax=Moniliophthora roreri TaxID=221103 RepID=A0A0W0FIQ2_MONRR